METQIQARKTLRGESEKRQLINRLSRIEGQIRGIRTMVEQDVYCAEILTQAAAARAALDAFDRELLSRHIRGCVSEDIRKGEASGDIAIDELLDLLRKLM